MHWSRKFDYIWMTCWFDRCLVSSRWCWSKVILYTLIMEEETYVLYSKIFFAICVLFWLTVLFCCLGPFIIWYTGEDEDGPVTLRESLRKSPYGQRSTPLFEDDDFPSILRHHEQSQAFQRRDGIRTMSTKRKSKRPSQ